MAFNNQGGGSDDDMAPLAEINIVPLVDVMLVLLIITMVTAPFMEQGLKIDLPVTQNTPGLAGVQDEKPLILYISKKSTLQLGETKDIKRSDLIEEIKKSLKTRKDKEIFVKADKKLEYGVIAEIMNLVQSAGVGSVSLVTVPSE